MTEQTTPNLSDIGALVVQMVTAETLAANAIAEKVAKSSVNVGKMVSEIRKDTNATDEKVIAFQKWEEKVAQERERRTQAINEHIKTNLLNIEGAMSDEERDAFREQYKTHKSSIAKAKALAAIQPGYSDEMFANVPALLTFKGTEASTSGGTGTKRPRFSQILVNGEDVKSTREDKNGDTVEFTNLTLVAKYLSKISGETVGAADLQEAAFAEAGTDDLSTVTDVEFIYSVNGENYTITAYPKQSAE